MEHMKDDLLLLNTHFYGNSETKLYTSIKDFIFNCSLNCRICYLPLYKFSFDITLNYIFSLCAIHKYLFYLYMTEIKLSFVKNNKSLILKY